MSYIFQSVKYIFKLLQYVFHLYTEGGGVHSKTQLELTIVSYC